MKCALAVLFLCLSLGGGSAVAAEVHLSVAASMTDATRALIAGYERSAAAVTILPNLGSSGALARQIAQGAPADLFVSANPKWMDFLVTQQLVPAAGVRTFAFNSLVLVGRKGAAIASLADLVSLRRIAIGSPKSVPAGDYAAHALKAAGLYNQLAGKLVLAQDVRQALAYAERGEVDAAFVYQTDALLAKEAVILLEVPQKLYDRVRYPVGLTEQGTRNPAAVAFYTYLQTPAAAQILKKYGFAVQ